MSVPRVVASWLLVMAVAAVALKAVDHVPTLLAGTPHGVRVYRSIDDAERAIGARVWMPGYYPDELRWPPARVEVGAAGPAAVAVRITGSDGDPDRLVIVQTIGAEGTPPSSVLPAGEPLGTSAVTVGSHPAVLARILLGTREVHDVSWTQDGRRIVLRYAGPVDRLLLMAASLRAQKTGGGGRQEQQAVVARSSRGESALKR